MSQRALFFVRVNYVCNVRNIILLLVNYYYANEQFSAINAV